MRAVRVVCQEDFQWCSTNTEKEEGGRMNVVDVVDHFYIALFSAFEQTHCTVAACESKWVTVDFYSVLYISTLWCSCSAVWFLQDTIVKIQFVLCILLVSLGLGVPPTHARLLEVTIQVLYQLQLLCAVRVGFWPDIWWYSNMHLFSSWCG